VYTPRSYRNDDPEALRQVMETYPFAIVISQDASQPLATHLPLIWTPGGDHGVLLGHKDLEMVVKRYRHRTDGVVKSHVALLGSLSAQEN